MVIVLQIFSFKWLRLLAIVIHTITRSYSRDNLMVSKSSAVTRQIPWNISLPLLPLISQQLRATSHTSILLILIEMVWWMLTSTLRDKFGSTTTNFQGDRLALVSVSLTCASPKMKLSKPKFLKITKVWMEYLIKVAMNSSLFKILRQCSDLGSREWPHL